MMTKLGALLGIVHLFMGTTLAMESPVATASSSTLYALCPPGCTCVKTRVQCNRQTSTLYALCPPGCTCVKTRVQCNRQTSIPALYKNITELYMQNNYLGPSINGSLAQLHELQTLDLSGNYIRQMDTSFFSGIIRLKTLDLSDNSLEELPDNIFASNSDLQTLNLSHNKFYILPSKSFRFLIRLRHLNMSHNHLLSPHLDIRFQIMVRLSVLDLSHNNFKNIPANSFEVIKKWDGNVPKYLDLSYSNIESLEDHALDSVRGLFQFDLSGNTQLSMQNLTLGLKQLENSDIKRLILIDMNITDIQTVLGNFSETSLEELTISHNSIQEIGANCLDYLVSLKKVDLSWNELTSLHGGLADLENLQILDASHNRLTKMQRKDIERLTELRHLNLSNNLLINIQEETFSHLNHLDSLDVSNNNIENFDLTSAISSSLKTLNLAGNNLIVTGDLVNIPKLTSIDFSNNKLKDIDAFLFRNCRHIKHVNFSHNHITKVDHQAFKPHVPEVIDLSYNYLYSIKNYNWIHAKQLYLQGNLITDIHYQAFYAMNNLNVLDLSRNALEQIDKDTFNYLTNMTTLLLQGNHLTFNPKDASLFRYMSNLRHLDLSQNLISKLRVSMFTRCEKLQYLSLAANQFSTFDPQTVLSLANLKVLHIGNNPFYCSCNLLDFKLWLHSLSKSSALSNNKNLVCEKPDKRRGTLIREFTLTDFECNHLLIYIIVVCSLVGLGLFVCLVVTLVCHFYNRWIKTRSLPDDDSYQYHEDNLKSRKHPHHYGHSILKDTKLNKFPQKQRHKESKPIKKRKLKLKRKKSPSRSNSVTFGLPLSRTADYILQMEKLRADPRIRRSRSLDFRPEHKAIYAEPQRARLPPTYNDHFKRNENAHQPRLAPMRRQSANRANLPYSYGVDQHILDAYGTARRRRQNDPGLGDYLDLPLVTYKRRSSNPALYQSASLPLYTRPDFLPLSNGHIPHQQKTDTKMEWV